jgi:hypothetical protein
MLPGFAGHLISEAFLEGHLSDGPSADADQATAARARRYLSGWPRARASMGPASSLRTMLAVGAEPLAAAFGFDSVADVATADSAMAATLRGSTGVVTLLVAPWGSRLDPLWRTAVSEAMRRSSTWCLLFNGTHLRIVDATRLFARRYAEFDLEQAIDDGRAFGALWTLAHAGALAGDAGAAGSLRALVDGSDRYASGVCRALQQNVLAAATEVLAALAAGRRPPHSAAGLDDAFEQALTIVYRLVFLLFAEARALVPVWHPVYRESYSLDALRTLVEGTRGAEGIWDALRAITRLAHAGCLAGDLKVTPFNGRLFAPARTPLAERQELDEEAAQRAILALSTRQSDRGGRERIAYRDLGVEQLGAVYETLLDYEPVRAPHITLRPGSGVRKATGTFYTPQPIADYLVRRTLGPLVHDAAPERILQLRVVDPSMGSGAFLVAACRFLAGAYEAALVQAGSCQPSDIGEPERASFRRTIAERCLYGVDLNPMAVQLARLSLWLTTLAVDRPLSFLDHRLQVGDSLLGVWLSALTHAPMAARTRRIPADRERLPFDEPSLQHALHEALPVRFSLESIPNDTVEAVRSKERAFAALGRRESWIGRWKQVADLWCATWLAADPRTLPPEAFHALSDAILTMRPTLSPHATERYLRASSDIARRRRLFHWELEFPEVFFADDGRRLPHGGFDAVLGNPPWEMMRADGDQGRPHSGRDEIRAVLRFTRDAGLYAAQSTGHANCYQLFLERGLALCRAGGRVGLVLPSGIATDSGSAPLRRLLLNKTRIDALVGFDNHRGVFPIHRSVRFLLLTAATGGSTDDIACRLGLNDPAELEAIGDERADLASSFPIRLSARFLQRVAGDDLTIPWVQTKSDVAILERATALFPPLGGPGGWNAQFGRELNATEDRHAFHRPGTGMPVVEGKQIQPFRVDLALSRHGIRPQDAALKLRDGRHLRPRLAYRDVASATNRLTLIAALLPAGCVSTHTLFCLRTPLALADQHVLAGLLNSFIVNYLVRLRVTTHVTASVVETLPVPTRADAPSAAREIAVLARRLARHHDAGDEARLHALVATLYQLTAEEFAYVLSTFPLVPEAIRASALAAFATETQRTQRTKR